MSKKGERRELGLKIREAILKFGHVQGEGTIVCLPTEDSRNLLGTNDEIDAALSEVGVNDKLVKDVIHKSGKKMTCIATTVEELSKEV